MSKAKEKQLLKDYKRVEEIFKEIEELNKIERRYINSLYNK